MRENLSFYPNNHTLSAAGRRIQKPYITFFYIYQWTKPTISEVHAEVWGLLVLVLSRSFLN